MSHTNEQHEQQPSPAEIARQHEAERRVIDRFAGHPGNGTTSDPRAKVNLILQVLKAARAEGVI